MAGQGDWNRYQGYRGRGSGSVALKVVVVLLALVLLAGILFVIFLGDWMEFTDEGVRFVPPWSRPSEAPGPVDSGLFVIDPAESSAPSPTPSAAPTPPPSGPPVSSVQAVEVSADMLRTGMAAQVVRAAGGRALLVEMKNRSGALEWRSRTALAAAMQVNATDDAVKNAIAALAEEGDLYLVAQVQCFRDLAASRQGLGTLVYADSGEPWYDGDGIGWASPASGEMREYLTALCLELTDMGFDEIVLSSAGYPDSGAVDALAWNDDRPADLTAPVEEFLRELAGALAERDVKLSVRTTEEALRGDDPASGLTAAVLARYADRVWLPAPKLADTDYASILTDAGMEGAEGRLVLQSGSGWSMPEEDPGTEPPETAAPDGE